MRIQFIHPPTSVNPKALSGLRPAPPLGLAYVAATLEKAGHEVRVLDAIALAPTQTRPAGRLLRLGLSTDEVVERIEPDVDAIGISSLFTFTWPVVRELIQKLHDAHPGVPIVCGGEHFNGLPELSMQQAPIDYVVRGEGEETAVELFGALEKGSFDPSTIPGIVWRRNGEIVRNEPRLRKAEIDDIPWPAWHLFDLDAYNRHGLKTGIDFGTMVPILATRGCPYSCTYCSSPQMWGTKWVTRDPVDVVNEVEHCTQRYGATNFPFQDLTIVIKKEWIVTFCNELIRRDLDIKWHLPSGTRLEVIDDEVAGLLHRSNCRSICYAPESASDETRKLIRKRMKKESLFAAVDAGVRNGLNITAFIVMGFPHDQDHQVRENFPFVRELARRGVVDVACGFFFPIPSTALYDDLVAKGRLISDDDLVLQAPLYSHDRYLTEEHNYCESIPAWRLTFYRYLLLLNFYVVSFVTHPRRVVRLLKNLFAGREESKFDSFVQVYVKHLRAKLRAALMRLQPRRVPVRASSDPSSSTPR